MGQGLTRRNRRTLLALVKHAMPPPRGAPSVEEVGLVGTLEKQLGRSEVPRLVGFAYRMALWFFEWLPFFLRPWRGPFSVLDEAEQIRTIQEWARSRVFLRRATLKLLLTYPKLYYYGDAQVVACLTVDSRART